MKNLQIVCTKDVHNLIYRGGEILALTEEGGDEYLLLLDDSVQAYKCFEIQVPIFVRKMLFGVLSLGPKIYGLEYSHGDMELLQIAVNFLSLAAENELLKNEDRNHKIDDNETQNLHPSSSEVLSSRPLIKRKDSHDEMLGNSSAIIQIRTLIEQVAPKDVTVLITGESGTGKELVAREIHKKSKRASKPLVTMNCAALPENLVESELFGHEKGAFTSAYAQKKGRFEIANNSTLFLDEIGDMSLATQAKLLRVLQCREFQRVGGNQIIETDVRIIAATNRQIEKEMLKRTFREDLYYRLNVVQIWLPPLRERKEDISILADYFIDKFNRFYYKNITGLTPEALEWFSAYHFPGNIRELQNIIERAIIMENGSKITSKFLPVFHAEASAERESEKPPYSLERLEKAHIEEVLNSVNYNKSHAAKILGIARKTLRQKIAKYGISQPA
ncbi:sigma 54-interacting transcriptional regulator [candidate division KSB1 bacterium]|nr:sigma 54-interacting transcriptional regulator [candidate division KSB1 bacterium]